MSYNAWPLGKVPKEFQRPELDQVKQLGYNWEDPRDVITMFEEKVAKFVGCKYAVAVDCCTHGLFLSLEYLKMAREVHSWFPKITLPKNTYISVPMAVRQAGFAVDFKDYIWTGIYQLAPYRVYDGAVRWRKDMYVGGDALQVVSFQIKKRIPIGRGGMILLDDKKAYETLKLMSYDGRDLDLPYDHPEHAKMMGYHFYMTPEDAARGIILMDNTPDYNEDSGGSESYPDVELMMNRI